MNPTHAADCDYLDKLRIALECHAGSAPTRAIRLLRIVEALSAAVDDEGSLPGSLCNEIVKWRKERT